MLDKLKIIALVDTSESSIGINIPLTPLSVSAMGVPYSIYIAMFNPEKFSDTIHINYQPDEAAGSTGSIQNFNQIPPRSFTFDFLIDGTGAAGEKRIVALDIELFKYTVGYVGTTHRPTFLILHWGTFLVRCIIKSYTINYTLFNSLGIPLRATINATFEEYVTPELEERINFLSSPDVTHERTVTAKDRLDLMSYHIYKTPKYYMELAKVNNLNQFRKLQESEKIFFPPVEKNKK